MTASTLQQTRSRGARLGAAAAAVALLSLVPGDAAGQGVQATPDIFEPTCGLVFPTPPSGATDRPDVGFNDPNPEYSFIHSSTHLQGGPATVKHAPGLFFTPPGSFASFRSLVVVNNPSPVATVNVTVQFYDTQGTPLSPVTTTLLPPEGSLDLAATPLFNDPASLSPGFGSAVVTADEPIVGGTIHHSYGVPGAVCDPDPFTPGATSMQQLQRKQANKTKVSFGPIPISNQQSHDFLNGILPLAWVRNPTDQPNNIQITYTSNTGLVVGPIAVTLPPNGSVLDQSIVLAALVIYTNNNPFNAYYVFEATSTSGLPLVGEMILTDFFGPEDGVPDTDGDLMDFGARFRMGSAMMANTERKILVDPEFTYQTGDPGVTTFVGIWNTSNQDVGPVTIRYFDRDGGVLATDSLASLPANQPAVVGPGLASSPNYPAPGVFDGWVQITACQKGLIGWTMRQTEGSGFRKVYGETLHGTNGQEPGDGFAVQIGNKTWTRKVKPVSQVWEDFWWPGYTNFVNDSVSNIGRYTYRFREFSTGAPFGAAAFGGLRNANTSFTYEDELVTTLGGPALISGRVDHAQGTIKGIGAIGDPLAEWQFPAHPDFVPFPTCTPDNP